jgi:DNA processing protein
MEEEKIYRLGLTRIPGIGPVLTKKLVNHFGGAEAVFHSDRKILARIGVRSDAIDAIQNFKKEAGMAELSRIQGQDIRMLFFTDEDYPQRLLSFPDSSPLLFYKGKADLNAPKVLAVIGTRAPSEHGKQLAASLIGQLAQPGLVIISGLAYGIDAAAHSAAVRHHIPTIGILGHGLGQVYPPEHAGLAKAMSAQGGLLTSFDLHTGAERHHFPMRNHLIAGLSDAVLVVETGLKGGSLLTIEKAREYKKKIFAVPGRAMDVRSAGCNWLIHQGIAQLVASGEQLQTAMSWKWPAGGKGIQTRLPFRINGGGGSDDNTTLAERATPETEVLELLKDKESLSFDELACKSRISASNMPMTLLNLELQGLVSPLPGKRYRLTT